MIKIIANIFVNTIRKWLSFYMRRRYGEKTNNVKNEISRLIKETKTVGDVHKELRSFKWASDPLGGLLDWSPDIYSFINKNKTDDCDSAAFYTKWLFSLIGIKTKIFSLVSKKPFIINSHVIAIAYIKKLYYVYSNGARFNQAFSKIEDALTWYINRSKPDTIYYTWAIPINY